MTRQQKIIATIVGIILGIIFLIWLVLFLTRTTAPDATTSQQPAVEPQRLPVVSGQADDTTSGATIDRPETHSVITALAMTFAERYGSYSSQSTVSVADSVADIVTGSLLAQLRAQPTGSSEVMYEGVTTKALSVQINGFDDAAGRATITVTTQRQEAKGSTNNPRSRYQTLSLQLVRTNNSWKVDTATWGN